MLLLAAFVLTLPPWLTARGGPEESFLAAAPGEFPDCRIRGRTFCTEGVHDYPYDRIQYLLAHQVFNLSSLIQSEGDPNADSGQVDQGDGSSNEIIRKRKIQEEEEDFVKAFSQGKNLFETPDTVKALEKTHVRSRHGLSDLKQLFGGDSAELQAGTNRADTTKEDPDNGDVDSSERGGSIQVIAHRADDELILSTEFKPPEPPRSHSFGSFFNVDPEGGSNPSMTLDPHRIENLFYMDPAEIEKELIAHDDSFGIRTEGEDETEAEELEAPDGVRDMDEAVKITEIKSLNSSRIPLEDLDFSVYTIDTGNHTSERVSATVVEIRSSVSEANDANEQKKAIPKRGGQRAEQQQSSSPVAGRPFVPRLLKTSRIHGESSSHQDHQHVGQLRTPNRRRKHKRPGGGIDRRVRPGRRKKTKSGEQASLLRQELLDLLPDGIDFQQGLPAIKHALLRETNLSKGALDLLMKTHFLPSPVEKTFQGQLDTSPSNKDVVVPTQEAETEQLVAAEAYSGDHDNPDVSDHVENETMEIKSDPTVWMKHQARTESGERVRLDQFRHVHPNALSLNETVSSASDKDKRVVHEDDLHHPGAGRHSHLEPLTTQPPEFFRLRPMRTTTTMATTTRTTTKTTTRTTTRTARMTTRATKESFNAKETLPRVYYSSVSRSSQDLSNAASGPITTPPSVSRNAFAVLTTTSEPHFRGNNERPGILYGTLFQPGREVKRLGDDEIAEEEANPVTVAIRSQDKETGVRIKHVVTKQPVQRRPIGPKILLPVPRLASTSGKNSLSPRIPSYRRPVEPKRPYLPNFSDAIPEQGLIAGELPPQGPPPPLTVLDKATLSDEQSSVVVVPASGLLEIKPPPNLSRPYQEHQGASSSQPEDIHFGRPRPEGSQQFLPSSTDPLRQQQQQQQLQQLQRPDSSSNRPRLHVAQRPRFSPPRGHQQRFPHFPHKQQRPPPRGPPPRPFSPPQQPVRPKRHKPPGFFQRLIGGSNRKRYQQQPPLSVKRIEEHIFRRRHLDKRASTRPRAKRGPRRSRRDLRTSPEAHARLAQDHFGRGCPSRSVFVHPKVAFSVSGRWMFIVNMPGVANHQQGIQATECLTSKCLGSCEQPPVVGQNQPSSACQLTFVQKRLMALGADGRSLVTELFWMPALCQCQG